MTASTVTASPRPLTILLAEDDPIAKLVATELLRQLGHRVEAVDDGRAAVAAVASGRSFDVVLMDLVMPELDGIGATRAIRALPGVPRELPIIALTAATAPAVVDVALDAGMQAVLVKPLDVARLVRILDALRGPPDPPADPAPVDCDEAVLAQLGGALGAGPVAAVMRGFLDDVGNHRDELDGLLASSPQRALAAAHRLAGSAATFGFRRLRDAFLEVETAVRADDPARARAALDRLPVLAEAALQNLAARDVNAV